MSTSLLVPFCSLTVERLVARGAGGQVFFITKNVVFKCPTNFNNPASDQADEIAESAGRIANEKLTHTLLMEHPHANIVRCILCIPEGFFMERVETTLQARIDHRSVPNAPSTHAQIRWITQIASALSWLEELGRVHGDLRPSNILLTADDNVRLADFDASVKIGEQLLVASEPYCKLDKYFKPPNAGPISEQFALASCIYTIRFGHIPLSELEAPDRVRSLINHKYPSTNEDKEFGCVIMSCWNGQYDSIRAVYEEIKTCYEAESVSNIFADSTQDMLSLLAECEEFLADEQRRKKNHSLVL
ncbi:Sperm motility kinase X [Colletotrichum fructicola Nara gc5]|uniref:Protein kinase domain-containing protein n=1 Tax=Colletotrichum fructicola (strain Nara gc5) TaxID=1213859 RepID=L2FS67_COLFN|nr:Sperm motility kinase X [Colletotrichum fructicola Nara gc5]